MVRLRHLRLLGHLHRRQLLPVRKRDSGAAEHLRDLRGRVLHASPRRLRLRATRRPDRAATRAGTRHPADVRLDAGHRPAADVHRDRRRRAIASAVPAMPAGLLRRRRIRRGRRLSGRIRVREAPRPHRHVHGVVGGARLPDRLGDGDAAAGAAANRRDGELRLAHPVPARRPAWPRRPLHPPAPGRHPAVRRAEQDPAGRQVAAAGGSAHRVAARSCK